ncbi:MAG: hypothetical protein QM433_09795 [Euryarchaeota archaeon]|nr:hypothetical protein [Euryarchaeota archaeon]
MPSSPYIEVSQETRARIAERQTVIDNKRRAEINEIVDRFNEMLTDPDFQREVQEFVRTTNRLTSEQLERRFTI